MDQLSLDLHHSLMELFWRIRRMRRKYLCEMGIVQSHYSVLKHLEPGEVLTLSEIGARARIESSNITSIIDWFEERGLFKRKRDPSDRRIVRVELTEEGEKYREEINSKYDEFITGIYRNVSEDELKNALDVIRLLSEKIIEETD